MIATALITHDEQCNSFSATAFVLAIFLLLRDAMLYILVFEKLLRWEVCWREFGEVGTTPQKTPQHLIEFETISLELIENESHWALTN